jgi:hypothetical protein
MVGSCMVRKTKDFSFGSGQQSLVSNVIVERGMAFNVSFPGGSREGGEHGH